MMDETKIVTEWLTRRGGIELPSWGRSMFPFMMEGERSSFEAFSHDGLRIGEVYLFITTEGKLVCHRLYDIQGEGDSKQYIFKGDTNIVPDEPVNAARILGCFTGTYKKKGWIPAHHWKLSLLTWITLNIPLWPKMVRRYLSFRRL
ncbi:hypothetical protein PVOR_28899 [Paenibacillus vortex V453]|jgi:signal peptidase|uniref:Signal peptidase I n=2 Tax=Paenibacillus TaxID=44249 RepID=A0A2R9SMR6_9BACL|nr:MULTISPECIES: hypothetical protein [Paenibacillus]ANA79285.1 signal peptidase I [Paenibacillus glucanolyticus]AVV56773.1 signal peptidase I [Paenibacillus glucanolyticus]EFU38631.1 hypothetical protein PVOR_28899 [Paenibacillus vortex V453]ETT37926.1 hypothetical protein C169_13719 [Paenibacillus sp. FSL R5-808]MDH6673540.1 signal peptidase [Paenibacillus sp. LBL]